MSFAEQLGLQLGGQAIGAGMGMMMGNWNDERQRKQQEYLQQLQVKGNKDMMDYGMQKQLQMWKDTSYGPQMEQMRKAGANPGMIYGMSGGGGQTTGNASGNVSGATAQQNPGEMQATMGMGLQMAQMAAQTALTQAQTEKAKVETTKTAGPDTENIKADTANKILNQVILDYTGKESKSEYENVREPNRTIEQISNADQLRAAADVATIVQEMMRTGKLKEKSLAEIEGIILQNSKTREETKNISKQFDILEQNLKGAQLSNIILELETKLQTETGIDKNSPAWMKILGRLFVQLFKQ